MPFRVLCVAVTFCLICCAVDTVSAEPRIPANERFFTGPDSDAQMRGWRLVNEIGCARCHELAGFTPIHERKAPLLERVGERVEVEWLRNYLADPHKSKPGALMPNVLAGLSEADRVQAVEALVHFLATTGSVHQTAPNRASVQNGEKVYHQVGCVACHGSRKRDAVELATSVPLGDLHGKYSIHSLSEFLKNPHQSRPSGRMPSLNLNDQEARDLANYFLQDVKVPSNLAYKVYEGGWSDLPDFGQMKSKTEGESSGFDLGVAGRANNFGIRFEGFLHLEADGEYKFTLGSDDGSWLIIGDRKIVDVNGTHPHQVKEARRRMRSGVHPLILDYFQGGGEWTLEAYIEGPGVPRQPLENLVTITREKPQDAPEAFQPKPALVEKGKSLFVSIGCVNCHEMKSNGETLAAVVKGKPLTAAIEPSGCLSSDPAGKAPYFGFTPEQITGIREFLKVYNPQDKPDGEQAVFHTLATFNCYACHDRNQIGGVEREREAGFVGTTPEMGDEGRIPPSLTGTGDKLNDNWLRHILNHGASDRPYMLTRMPKFGVEHVEPLLTLLPELDRKTEAPRAEFDQPEYRLKAEGRLLVGDRGLSCIKCHPFGSHKSTGIQAINLQAMTNRLREDWYNRYMLNPQLYRSGTRMPAAWPNGRAIFTDVLDGHTQQQISAVWLYLSDGPNAAVPIGVGGEMIVLEPADRPIIYRNFLEGLSPRGIGVGYPEGVNLAYDAEQMGMRQIWHGAFIDAGKHWVGRGPGAQSALGDHLVRLPEGQPFARLGSLDVAWPAAAPRSSGYRFLGYRLDEAGRPAFRYEFSGIEVEDAPLPVKGARYGTLTRRVTLTAKNDPGDNLYFRAATGQLEAKGENEFTLDGILTLKVTGGVATLRKIGGTSELLVPVTWANNRAELTIEYNW